MSESDKIAIEQFQENVKLRRENTELHATIEHLRAVCRLAVSDGHATPYLTHMVDQATKAHTGLLAQVAERQRGRAAELQNSTRSDLLHALKIYVGPPGGEGWRDANASELADYLTGVVVRLWTPEGER